MSLGVIARAVEALLRAIWMNSRGIIPSAKQAMQALDLAQEKFDL